MKRAIPFTIIFIGLFSYIARAEEIPLFDKDAFIASAGDSKVLEIGMVDCVAMALKNNSEIHMSKLTSLSRR